MVSKKFLSLLLISSLFTTPIALSGAPAQAQQSALTRPWVGLIPGEADAQPGVAIATVLRRSPAHRAGLQDGDRVLSVNGDPVRTPGKLTNLLGSQPIGRTIELELKRNEEHLTVKITLETAPSSLEVHRLHLKGFPAPDIELKSLTGESVKLSQFSERPLLLEFWATWCTVCRRVTRQVERFLGEHPGSFDVLAITAEDKGTVEQYLQTSPMKLRIALDAENLAHDQFLANSYPHIVLIGADGTIENVATTVEQVEELLKDLLHRRQKSAQ